MIRNDESPLDCNIALHSGDYVRRYKVKPITRVKNLLPRMRSTKGTSIADFGCGTGMLLQTLNDDFTSYDGIDFSPEFITAANEWAEETNRKNYKFHCQDICEFCDRYPKYFDIAATLDLSEHIEDETAIRIYSSIHNCLKLNGHLYLHTPNLDFFLERAKVIGIIPQFPEHIAVRNAQQTVALLEKSGFNRSAIQVEMIPHYNVLSKLHPFSKLPVVGKYLSARLWIKAVA